jgi:hypothetical protein
MESLTQVDVHSTAGWGIPETRVQEWMENGTFLKI